MQCLELLVRSISFEVGEDFASPAVGSGCVDSTLIAVSSRQRSEFYQKNQSIKQASSRSFPVRAQPAWPAVMRWYSPVQRAASNHPAPHKVQWRSAKMTGYLCNNSRPTTLPEAESLAYGVPWGGESSVGGQAGRAARSSPSARFERSRTTSKAVSAIVWPILAFGVMSRRRRRTISASGAQPRWPRAAR